MAPAVATAAQRLTVLHSAYNKDSM